MIANQFMGVRLYEACFPKVDWTRDDWTVEKILKTVADYTDEEIQAVLDTMDKDYTIKDDASIERLFGEYLK
jgi:L-arabinose isomerase